MRKPKPAAVIEPAERKAEASPLGFARAAVAGLAEAAQAESAELGVLRSRMVRLARQARR